MEKTVLIEIDPQERWRCSSPAEMGLRENDTCIVSSGNLLEFGRVIAVEESGTGGPCAGRTAKVLRRATLQDHARANENAVMNKMALKTCNAKKRNFNLEMRIVKVRYSFDRTVLWLVFTSDERLEYAAMARELASELKARVEIRQIGVRDEAGMIGGLGVCGRNLCCRTWIKSFDAVNVKMAKTQGLSLNPGSISGMCGRLKCCLRYENDFYRDAVNMLPREHSEVETPDGSGTVVSCNVLKQSVRVRLSSGGVSDFDLNSVRAAGKPHAGKTTRSGYEDSRCKRSKS